MIPQPSPNPATANNLQSIKQNAHLWYKIRVLIFDLRHFASNPHSKARLELIIDPTYIASPHFTASEAQLLKSSTAQHNGQTLQSIVQDTLAQNLNRRKRVQSADYRPCAAHDLAPIFERFFDIRPKDLQGDKDFVKSVEKNGLGFRESELMKWESEDGKVKKAKKKKKNILDACESDLRKLELDHGKVKKTRKCLSVDQCEHLLL